MTVRNARKAPIRHTYLAAQRLALTASLVLFGCESLQDAVAEGDTRTISLHHMHTDEDLTVTYKRNGRYDEAALKKLNHMLRDWRRNEEINIDPRLIDLVWEAQRELNGKDAVQIVCGYRAPETNEMLRHRSRNSGVARYSQHTLGKAIDFYLPGVALDALRAEGLRLQRGGVGFYPSSGSPFVHLDIGSVRHWPRMTREELARVFPDGRTVHIPADGHPLSGYALALADIEKRGAEPSALSLAAAQRDGIDLKAAPKRNLFAKLFGAGRDKDEDEDSATTASAVKAVPAVAVRVASAAASEPEPQAAPAKAAIPLPKVRPAVTRVVSAERAPQPARNAGAYSLAAVTPNDIIRARGYWQGLPDSPPADLSAMRRRPAETAAADPAPTGSIGPFAAPVQDRVPADLALAYAAQAAQTEPAASRPAAMGAAMPDAAASAEAGNSIARKSVDERPSEVQSAPLPAPAAALRDRPDDPWLRAVTMTPSVERFLSTTLLGAIDFAALRPLLQKPAAMLVMTFSDDPHLGMTHATFSGSAVVFLATATFTTRTAALQ